MRVAELRCEILRRVRHLAYSDAVSTLGSLRDQLWSMVDTVDLRCEIDRVIASDMFQTSLAHEVSPGDVFLHFKHLCDLGFSEVGHKVTAYYCYAEYCSERGLNALARETAQEILTQLSEDPRSESEADTAESIALFNQFLNGCGGEPTQ